MIRELIDKDSQDIYTVVNDAADSYRGKIPLDRWKEPYISTEELLDEIQGGLQFSGYFEGDKLIAVMGIQRVGDVTLIRHSYTLTNHQRNGIGEKLLNNLLCLAQTDRILVGTWETASWAIKFYQKHGFIRLSRVETDELLKKHWKISERQVETSIVLEYEGKPQ
jgi:GNAT superfamily N-acetyltransferase